MKSPVPVAVTVAKFESSKVAFDGLIQVNDPMTASFMAVLGLRALDPTSPLLGLGEGEIEADGEILGDSDDEGLSDGEMDDDGLIEGEMEGL